VIFLYIVVITIYIKGLFMPTELQEISSAIKSAVHTAAATGRKFANKPGTGSITKMSLDKLSDKISNRLSDVKRSTNNARRTASAISQRVAKSRPVRRFNVRLKQDIKRLRGKKTGYDANVAAKAASAPTTPKKASATTPKKASATTPKKASATTPKKASATTSGAVKAASKVASKAARRIPGSNVGKPDLGDMTRNALRKHGGIEGIKNKFGTKRAAEFQRLINAQRRRRRNQ